MTATVRLPTLEIELPGATYVGPTVHDVVLAEEVPTDLSAVLADVNGFVAFDGALHVRGVCADPPWHSLGGAWHGDEALYRLFPAIAPSDVPFAQDALGNQFVMRDGLVWRLESETGQLRSLNLDIQEWLASMLAAPDELLPVNLVKRFRADGHELLPGDLLSVYPPFCSLESADGVSLRAVPALGLIASLADFAAKIAACDDGSRIRIVVDTRS